MSVNVIGATTISAVTSPHVQGVYDVVITNPDGQSARLANAFTYLSVPEITRAEVIGKKLYVYGANFDDGAKLFLNGEKQKKTFNDEINPATILIANKAGKKIAASESVTLQVQNSDGRLSNPFQFTRALSEEAARFSQKEVK